MELMCRSTPRVVIERLSATALLLRPSAISARISRSRGVRLLERGVLRPPHGQERIDDLRIDDRSSGGDLPHRSVQLPDVLQPLLEEVAATFRPVLQQRHRVDRVGMLAQHEHADLGMRRRELRRELDALVRECRRHPDVGEQDVGLLALDRRASLCERLARRDELDVFGASPRCGRCPRARARCPRPGRCGSVSSDCACVASRCPASPWYEPTFDGMP